MKTGYSSAVAAVFRKAVLTQPAKERKELHDEMDKIRVATDEPRVYGWSGDARRARRPGEFPTREGRSHDCCGHGLTSLEIFASWQIGGQSVAAIILPKAVNVTASPRAAARR